MQVKVLVLPAILALLAMGLADAVRGQEGPLIPQGWPTQSCSPNDSTGRTVWGSIRDALRQPLAGVQVYAPGLGCGMLTDSAGRYAVIGIPDGDFWIRAELIGYLSDSTELSETADVVRHDFVLPLERGDEQLMYIAGSNPWKIPRPVAADVVGCYSIVVLAEYGPPIRPYDGPWETRPAGFRGLPSVVLVDTFSTTGDSLALVGRTLRHTLDAGVHVDTDDSPAWQFDVTGDSLEVSWTGSPMLWWIRYRLSVDVDSMAGRSWYVSHEPGSATAPRVTVWRRARCRFGGIRNTHDTEQDNRECEGTWQRQASRISDRHSAKSCSKR